MPLRLKVCGWRLEAIEFWDGNIMMIRTHYDINNNAFSHCVRSHLTLSLLNPLVIEMIEIQLIQW